MIPEWKKNIILKMKKEIDECNNKLVFIHTPKCGGTYSSQYMSVCNIKNNGHNQAIKIDKEVIKIDKEVTFTIIRDPIKRFESFLNYRLGNNMRDTFPDRLHYFFDDKSKTLNDIINEITYEDTLLFSPYKSLTHWSQNVDLLITIDELEETLKLLGYNIENYKFENLNVSVKERGTINDVNKQKLSKFYENDIKLYNHWTRK